MADFKIEIIFDGDQIDINVFDLVERVKTSFSPKEISDIPNLQVMVSKARIVKDAFILVRDNAIEAGNLKRNFFGFLVRSKKQKNDAE